MSGRFNPTPSLQQPTATYAATAIGAISVISVSNMWTNAFPTTADLYVANAGSYTGITQITPFGSRAVTVPNAVLGMMYRIPQGATLHWGVGGSVVSIPVFDGFGE